jgi:NADH-quinone oxidoreductase subunit L
LPFNVKSVRYSAKSETRAVMLIPVILLGILSIGIFFSFNPINFSESWILHGVSLKGFPLQTNILSEDLINQLQVQHGTESSAHLAIGFVSTILACAGVGLALVLYKRKSSESLLYEKPESVFAKLSHHHFYLDQFYQAAFVNTVLSVSRTLYRIDKRAIDYTLNYSSKWLVVFSKVIAWVDRTFVDGTVTVITLLAKFLGRFGRGLQNGKVQSYYAYSLFGFILIILYIVLF